MVFTEKNYYNLIQRTAELVEEDPLTPTIIFCEDKITLSLEIEITKLCGGSFFCEVTTLNRFMKKFSCPQEVCSKQTISLIIKKLLTKHNEELTCFKNTNSYSLAGSLAEVIAQLKSAKVRPLDLLISSQNFNGAFRWKLKDIAIIYERYEEYLEDNGLLDTNNKFSLFLPLLKDFPLEDYKVMIVGFQSVTAQTASLFSHINQRAKNLDFLVLKGQEHLYVNEVYSFAESLYQFILPSLDFNHEKYDLVDNLYNPTKRVGRYSDKIKIYSYTTVEEEVVDIARQIKNLVINGGKWQDNMLILADSANYIHFVKKTLDDYEIPYFSEETFNLSNHPLVKAICDYIDLKYKRFDLAFYKKVLRHSALFSDSYFVSSYIDYINKNAYGSASLLNGEIPEEEFERFRKFTLSLPKIYAEDKAVNYCKKIIALLEETKAFSNLEILANRLIEEDKSEQAEFILNGYDYILKILDEIEKVLGNEETSAREFKSLLLSGAAYTELAIIPQSRDRVYVGDFNACKYRNSKNLFVCGLSSGVPSAMADNALLSDGDLKRLDKLKIIIEPKIDVVNARTKENVGVALSNFTDSLTLSYPTTILGKENLPSDIIQEVCDIFSNKDMPVKCLKKGLVDSYLLTHGTRKQKIEQKTKKFLTKHVALKSFALDVSNYKYLKDVNGAFSELYACVTDEVLKARLDKILASANATLGREIKGSGELFFRDNKVSATVVESYYTCPYYNFLRNGLGIKNDDLGEFDALNLGTFLHEVYEIYEKRLSCGKYLGNENLETLANELIAELLKKEEYNKYVKKPEYENLFKLLAEEIVKMFSVLLSDSKKTEFKPKYFEYSFGDGKQKGLKLKTKCGDYELRGKIDRVDMAGELVRIIDYKTGSTANFESEDKLFVGKKLQLYLYLNIFLEQNYIPAGVYYAPMNNEYLISSKEKEKSLKGKTVNDSEILLKTDSQYLKGSTIIDVGVDKNGKVKLKNTINSDTLIALCKYARLLTSKAVEKIKENKAVISPLKDSCKYCEFLGLCGFTKEKFAVVRDEIKITQEEIQKIAEGQDE